MARGISQAEVGGNVYVYVYVYVPLRHCDIKALV